jgi:SAM-dependent methyltransferase
VRPTEFHLSRHPREGHDSLALLWQELGYTVGAEIGTEQGKFAAEICSVNPQAKLYCVDPWMAYDRYRDHRNQNKLDGFYADAVARLKSFNAELVRKTSMDAVKDFAPLSLDFCYIDGNHHFDYVVEDIVHWSRIVKPGGIVAGHDYRHEGKEDPPIPFHVIQAVNAYTDSHKINPWFVMRGDKCASWMFVKGDE